MPTLTLALKDLRLLLRDPRSAVILLAMPLILILVLGLALDEGFGQKPDARLRIAVVNLDRGPPEVPGRTFPPPGKKWSDVVIDDLSGTADIRLEIITDRAEAERLVDHGKRAAVIIFEPDFSAKVDAASFLSRATPPPINPLDRNGIRPDRLGLTLRKDPTSPVTASVIEQVTQVTLMRVVIPWMIGKAFARVGDAAFMDALARRLAGEKLGAEALAQLDPAVQKLLTALLGNAEFRKMMSDKFGVLAGVIRDQMPAFRALVSEAFKNPKILADVGQAVAFGEVMTPAVREAIRPGIKAGIKDLFSNYNFEATTWAQLTQDDPRAANPGNRTEYVNTEGSGVIRRGAWLYQILVPSYTVMFAFFLVLTVGWLFVAERKHGTLVRLRAAPLSRGEILLGKLLPCLAVSLVQGVFLLLAGKVVFNMNWGPEPGLVFVVAVCTSAAAVGLAMLVASIARTETQVAVYGTLLVLVLGGVSGSLMPRELMPESMKRASLVTPQAWALDAYSQLLTSQSPDLTAVATACLVLLGFGAAFLAVAWWRLDLE